MAHVIFQLLAIALITIFLMHHVNSQPALPPVCPTGSPQVNPLPFPFPAGCVPALESSSVETQGGPTNASNGKQPEAQVEGHTKWQSVVSLAFFFVCLALARIIWVEQQQLFVGFNRIADYYSRWTNRRRQNALQLPPSPTGPYSGAIPLVDIPANRHVGEVVEEEDSDMLRVPPRAHH